MSAVSLDADLVEAARRGSSRAYERLVSRHQQAVRSFLRRVCGDWRDADDLAQETFVAGWGALGRYDGSASLRTWLCAIAYRKALTHQRARRRALERDTHYAAGRCEAADDASPEDHVRLRRAMAQLPVEQRAVVSLCLASDFSHNDAAKVMNLPLGTVKSHLNRGRQRLLEILGGGNDRT
jgi:RNA polymerase sigma-70 factor (ECF subfamily)